METSEKKRAGFIAAIEASYMDRDRNVVVLTGNINDVFRSKDRFVGLEQALYERFSEDFYVLRMDTSGGITLFDETAHEEELAEAIATTLTTDTDPDSPAELAKYLAKTQRNPVSLECLVMLRHIERKLTKLRSMEKNDGRYHALKSKRPVRPACIILPHAGALFPAGDYGRMSELDRQRLVFLLNWINSPLFAGQAPLLVMITDTRSELNSKILELPHAAAIEVKLPDATERSDYVDLMVRQLQARYTDTTVTFEGGMADFAQSTTGLTLSSIGDMLEAAVKREGGAVKREGVVAEVNEIMQRHLGEIVRFVAPAHSLSDIVGGEQTTTILTEVFARCDDPETAISAVLVAGPNGGGKTFRLEAHAKASGRTPIELTGIRGSLFGETERLWELLRFHIEQFGKVLILVDEAHTAFGSVHRSDVHETERRLSGNLIKMMGNPRLRGRVLWALMTSRPDELDPDVKSRAPIQVPIFDLEGDDRKAALKAMLGAQRIVLPDEVLGQVYDQTLYYSNRDFDNLAREFRALRKRQPGADILQTLQRWRASTAIVAQRRLQTLVAAQHCSYPELVPPSLREIVDGSSLEEEIALLKHRLNY